MKVFVFKTKQFKEKQTNSSKLKRDYSSSSFSSFSLLATGTTVDLNGDHRNIDRTTDR